MTSLTRLLPGALRKGGVDYARRARLLIGIALSILGFNVLVTLIFLLFLKEHELARASAMASLGCALVLPILRYTGSVSFAGNVLLVDMWATLHILAIYLTGAHDAPVAWVILLPVLAITICNTASGIVWTIFAALEIGFAQGRTW